MNSPWISMVSGARWAARVLIVALALIPLVIVALASVPALVVLPFSRRRSTQAAAIVRQLGGWTRALLLGSRER
ncbi:dTMP kinase [Streptomyces sp. NPDC127112]|uniref:dTMP kinase n=1 Tax=Streptomyces sp. NPDC127112 TaxID=3345364 RepID=UPI0036416BFD